MSSHKKFRLSDMIPNASHWFSMKLKQIGTKTTTTAGSKRRKKNKKNKTHHSSSSPAPPHYPLSPQSYHSRKSYHFTRQLTTNKTAPAPTPAPAPTTSPESLLVSVSAGWDSHSTPFYSTPYTNSPKNSITNHHDTNSCNLNNRRDNQQVIHLDSNTNSLTEFHRITSHQQERHTLPPIKTVHNHGKKLKTTTTRHTTTTNNNFRQIKNPIIKVVVNEESLLVTPSSSPARKQRFTSGSSPGIRLRINSPRIARIPQLGNYYPRRKTTLNNNSITSKNRTTSVPVLSSESLAIVKSSLDPQRDFRESMVEMIVENRINTANDLEDLLACYLSLNADEYHHVIIKVFKQLWFDLKRRQSS